MARANTIKVLRGGRKISPRREVMEQLRLRTSLERKLSFNLMTQFAEIGNTARTEFEARGGIEITGSFIERRIRSVLEPHWRTVIEKFGTRVLSYRKQDSQFETIIRQYLTVSGLQSITNISNTTRKLLLSTIIAGEADALGNAAIGQMIFDTMRGEVSKRRAMTISRTETHTAASFANDEVARSMNLPDLQKQWVSVSDDRTRSFHAQMNGVTMPMDEDFIVPVNGIEYRMERPGDPRGGAINNINCRCVLIYVEPDDELVDV